MSENTCWWLVGNHAQSFTEYITTNRWVNYRLSPSLEHNHGTLSFSPTDREEEIVYTSEAMQKVLKTRMNDEAPFMLVGDISERIMGAAVHAGVSSERLIAVYLLYPLGMVALDVRKEMAEIILTLKKAQVPTFLIRKPEVFFKNLEPNPALNVRKFLQEEQRTSVEYLCGLSEVTMD